MASSLAFPSIYLIHAHLTHEEQQQLQSQIPILEKDARKAGVILGRLSRKERAQFELRHLRIATEEVPRSPPPQASAHHAPSSKRRKLSGGTSETQKAQGSESSEDEDAAKSTSASQPAGTYAWGDDDRPTVKVVKLAWFKDSIASGKVLPLTDYLVYEGRMEPESTRTTQSQPSMSSRTDTNEAKTSSSSPRAHRTLHGKSVQPPSLVRKNTSEHEGETELPPLPDCLRTTYSCQRRTPANPPNKAFIKLLKKIRTTRELTGDQIGVRAYSTAIASLSAYPYVLAVSAEVTRLPGCGPKFAKLFREFSSTGGHVHEAGEAETDPKLSVLRQFCDIWGVAEATAHTFYNRGWRDLDDIVEYGWAELTRVQQIGVKYYDELQQSMTRAQAETIANTVLDHANQIFPGFQMVIVGGYRRGKEMSGDVDVLLSHPDETATRLIIGRLVLALEQAGRITHTLTLSAPAAEQDRERSQRSFSRSTDSEDGTLDKALVVWQEPMEAHGHKGHKGHKKKEERKESAVKNTNPHRRVDIIVTPWKTVGCAVLGWSGGTTFQRDLRRYCKRVRGLRFDSSGTHNCSDGSWVDLEDFVDDPAPDMLTAERRVFTALGLEWLPPDERCTG